MIISLRGFLSGGGGGGGFCPGACVRRDFVRGDLIFPIPVSVVINLCDSM